MALSQQQQAAIARARDRVAATAIQLDREFFDEAFTFKFLPTLNQPALDIVTRVQQMSVSSTPNLSAQLDALLEFMDVMALPDTAEMIAELGRGGIMSINDLVDLQMSVVEAISGRPTTRSSLSPTGSDNSGSSSTASAPREESTPQPSPSTV